MKKLLCPSMMCANFGNLENEIRKLEESGIDIFHLDVMDGSFVPNFGMGLQDIEYICKTANKPSDGSKSWGICKKICTIRGKDYICPS